MTTVAGSSPYLWPYDGAVDPSALALLVCGSGPEWSNRTSCRPEAEENIALLRGVATEHGVLVVLLVHGASDRRSRFSAPTDASPTLVPDDGERLVRSSGIDGFYGSDLDHLLHQSGRTHLLLAGRGLETTVHSTLRRANDRGYECLTVTDACSPIDPTLQPAAISSIEMSGGIFGAVAETTAVFDLLAVPTPEDSP